MTSKSFITITPTLERQYKKMTAKYVKPASKIDTLRKAPLKKRSENNMRNLETRVKAAKGDTYQLMMYKKNIKIMI